MEKVSIIVNFYNSEKYIPKLFKSVVRLTYPHWELICVNDCSPQNDSNILRKLVSKYHVEEKVKIIDNPQNLGIFRAKQVGIKAATGKYITFMDGDDWMTNDALEKLVKPTLTNDIDLVIANSIKIIPFINRKWSIKTRIPQNDYHRIFVHEEIIDRLLINFFGINIVNCAYWAKLYKKDLLSRCNFDMIHSDISEDQWFNLEVFQQASTMWFIEDEIYYWRWGGFTSGKKNNLYQSIRYAYANAEYYLYRLKVIEKYNYTKAIYPLAVEAKNVLKTIFTNLAIYPPSDYRSKEVVSEISKLLKHPVYEQVKSLAKADSNRFKNPLYSAMIHEDAEAIYEYCHNLYKSQILKRTLKRFLHMLLYH